MCVKFFKKGIDITSNMSYNDSNMTDWSQGGIYMIKFIPFQFPETDGWVHCLTDGQVLRHRREEMRLTQQQVADKAGIQLRQYQRFESNERGLSGASMRIGLSVCSVLKLDPYEIMPDTDRDKFLGVDKDNA